MSDISEIDNVAPLIRQLRKDAGLTQAQLATAAGLSRQRVVGIETGQAANIELITLIRILEALGAQLTIRRSGRRNLNEILRDNRQQSDEGDMP